MELIKIIECINKDRMDLFYRSTSWRKKRKEIIKRDNYECQHCKRLGRQSKAECVHHIEEIKIKPSKALTDTNLISLCNNCHNKIHDKNNAEHLNKNSKLKKLNDKFEEKW